MRTKELLITALATAFFTQACGQTPKTPAKHTAMATEQTHIMKSDEEWKKELTPEQFSVLRKQGTERPYTGKYWDNHEHGTYYCAACHLALFSSDTKFDSGTGWPSFYQPIAPGAVIEHTDKTLGMERTEVVCSRCGGHLGHVFDDGPNPTGMRYCMNSVSMDFEKK